MMAEEPDPLEDAQAIDDLRAENSLLREAAQTASEQRDAACEEVADALTEIARLRKWLAVIAGESTTWRSVLSRRGRGQWDGGSRADAVLNARRIANLALGGLDVAAPAATADEEATT